MKTWQAANWLIRPNFTAFGKRNICYRLNMKNNIIRLPFLFDPLKDSVSRQVTRDRIPHPIKEILVCPSSALQLQISIYVVRSLIIRTFYADNNVIECVRLKLLIIRKKRIAYCPHLETRTLHRRENPVNLCRGLGLYRTLHASGYLFRWSHSNLATRYLIEIIVLTSKIINLGNSKSRNNRTTYCCCFRFVIP